MRGKKNKRTQQKPIQINVFPQSYHLSCLFLCYSVAKFSTHMLEIILYTKIQIDILLPNWPLKCITLSSAGKLCRYDVDDFRQTRYGV